MPGRRPARRPLADRGALLADLAEELAVSRRVSAVHSAGKDSDRCPRRGERATVGTPVDSVGPRVDFGNPITLNSPIHGSDRVVTYGIVQTCDIRLTCIGPATGERWSHPWCAQNWPIGRCAPDRQRALIAEMSVSSACISMHRPTYSLTVGSIPSAVIGGFIYRLVGNQIADSERRPVG